MKVVCSYETSLQPRTTTATSSPPSELRVSYVRRLRINLVLRRRLCACMDVAADRTVPLKSVTWRGDAQESHCNGGSFKLRLAVELSHHVLGSIFSDICRNKCVIISSTHDISHSFNRPERSRPVVTL
jgi:hypothetical protein